MIFDNFLPVNVGSSEPEQISHCLLQINSEINNHLLKLKSEAPVNVKKLRDQHNFDINVRMVIEDLADHIQKCIKTNSVKRKDIFISLYTYEKSDGKDILKYESHYDYKRDSVTSKVIDISDNNYKNYECVKCMLSTDSTVYVLDKKKYEKGDSKRYRTVAQYMGCKLESEKNLFGFMNIEFHNKELFLSEEEMQDFMEQNIFPFKQLVEYQYLKRHFFKTFECFEDNWRLA